MVVIETGIMSQPACMWVGAQYVNGRQWQWLETNSPINDSAM